MTATPEPYPTYCHPVTGCTPTPPQWIPTDTPTVTPTPSWTPSPHPTCNPAYPQFCTPIPTATPSPCYDTITPEPTPTPTCSSAVQGDCCCPIPNTYSPGYPSNYFQVGSWGPSCPGTLPEDEPLYWTCTEWRYFVEHWYVVTGEVECFCGAAYSKQQSRRTTVKIGVDTDITNIALQIAGLGFSISLAYEHEVQTTVDVECHASDPCDTHKRVEFQRFAALKKLERTYKYSHPMAMGVKVYVEDRVVLVGPHCPEDAIAASDQHKCCS